jgi:hypothetical protein
MQLLQYRFDTWRCSVQQPYIEQGQLAAVYDYVRPGREQELPSGNKIQCGIQSDCDPWLLTR